MQRLPAGNVAARIASQRAGIQFRKRHSRQHRRRQANRQRGEREEEDRVRKSIAEALQKRERAAWGIGVLGRGIPDRHVPAILREFLADNEQKSETVSGSGGDRGSACLRFPRPGFCGRGLPDLVDPHLNQPSHQLGWERSPVGELNGALGGFVAGALQLRGKRADRTRSRKKLECSAKAAIQARSRPSKR